jgi:hypothetical protein
MQATAAKETTSLLQWRDEDPVAWKTSFAPGRRLGWGLIAAILLTVHAPAAPAQPALDPGRVPWTFFALQAEKLGNRITTQVRIATLPAAAERARFAPSPQGVAFSPAGPELVKLSAITVIEILGRQPVRIESQVWFDPQNGAPLFCTRTRSGVDDYDQRFWFTREGVHRRQREPASRIEAAGPADAWTKLGEHFYPYGPAARGCPRVLETSTLIYLLSAIPITEKQAAPPVCVFHKRHLHRVRFNPEAAPMVSVDFLEKTPAGENRRSGAMPAQRIRIESQPVGSYRGEVEDFFEDGPLLHVSPDGRLPLMVSCELPLIGRMELRLKEIHLK